MSKIPDYIERVSADTAEDLIRKVHQLIEEGWKPTGQPRTTNFTDLETGENRTSYCQFVYRYKLEGDISLPL